jgi:hypothetical protein
MAKTKTAGPKNRRKVIFLGFVLVALVVAGLAIYKQHQKNEAIAKERAQYVQAEKDLDALSAQIITKFGQPDDQKKVKECGHTSDTFELAPKGELFCNVANYLTYPVNNLEEAKADAIRLETAISPARTESNFLSNSMATEPFPVKIGTKDYKDQGLNCFRSYTYVSPGELIGNVGFPKLQLSTAQGLLVQTECGAQTPKAVYYPLQDN